MRSLLCFCFFLCLTYIRGQHLTLEPSAPRKVTEVGKAFFVVCTGSGKNVQRVMWVGPEGKQITKYQGRMAGQRGGSIHVEDSKFGHRGVELHFRDTKQKDSGNYTCSAHIDGREVEKFVEIIILMTPNFTDTPKEQFLEEGRNSTLVCNVVANPEAEIGWSLNSTYLLGSKGNKSKYARHPSNKDYLIVINATLSDAGNYTCAAVQRAEGTVQYKVLLINVVVHHKPLEASNYQPQAVSYVLGVVNLTCEAVAEPQANFTWIKEGDKLTDSDNVVVYNESNKSILQLTVENRTMFGDYICVAENHLGKLERVISLGEGRQPTKPIIKLVSSGSRSLTVEITAVNSVGELVKSYRFEYKPRGEKWVVAKHQTLMAGKNIYEVRGLDPNKLYVVRALSQNAAGYSLPSNETYGKTLALNAAATSQGSSLTCTYSQALLLFQLAFIYSLLVQLIKK